MAFALEFLTVPGAFIDAAKVWLAVRPVVNTVVASAAERAVRDDKNGVLRSGAPFWFVVVRDEQRSVVGAGMRAASFAPYPLYLLPMPEPAAVDLAQVLVDRGEEVGGGQRCSAGGPGLRHGDGASDGPGGRCGTTDEAFRVG